ncbi:hypothetical protein ABIE53_005760 [Burkholderia sp. OAS925]
MAQAVMVLAIGDIAYWLVSCTEPGLYDRLFWAAFFTAVLVPVSFVQFQPEAAIYLARFPSPARAAYAFAMVDTG